VGVGVGVGVGGGGWGGCRHGKLDSSLGAPSWYRIVILLFLCTADTVP
jgi:hypothetical protein